MQHNIQGAGNGWMDGWMDDGPWMMMMMMKKMQQYKQHFILPVQSTRYDFFSNLQSFEWLNSKLTRWPSKFGEVLKLAVT